MSDHVLYSRNVIRNTNITVIFRKAKIILVDRKYCKVHPQFETYIRIYKILKFFGELWSYNF